VLLALVGGARDTGQRRWVRVRIRVIQLLAGLLASDRGAATRSGERDGQTEEQDEEMKAHVSVDSNLRARRKAPRFALADDGIFRKLTLALAILNARAVRPRRANAPGRAHGSGMSLA
jgi:hypothetical protein